MKIGALLKIHRVMEKQGVRELATEIDISPSTISRIENGKKMDSEATLKLINWLFKEEECK